MFNFFKKKTTDRQYNEELEKRIKFLVNENETLEVQIDKSNKLNSIKDNLIAQNKGHIQTLQEEVNLVRRECKDMIYRNEQLFNEVKGMKIAIMNKKDAQGRLMSRFAPMIDEDGYELMKSGKGRMKFKLTHADGKKNIVYVELEKA